MTEEEWLASSDVENMLQHKDCWTTLRAIRLFGSACCRLVQHLFPDSRGARTLDLWDLGNDGAIEPAEQAEWNQLVQDLHEYEFDVPAEYALRAIRQLCGLEYPPGAVLVWRPVALALEGEAIIAQNGAEYLRELLDAWVEAHLGSGRPVGWTAEDVYRPLADLLRCIVGNPFRPVAFDPTWRTEHTVGLAARMYDERDFRAMPILADALEEAGCDSADVLSHCREPGPHARGCWVVDGVLGKW